MAKLSILSIAYPFARVSVDSAGGAEQILAAVDAAIVAAGHRSIVIAAEGSRVAGDLVPVRVDEHVLDGAAVGRVHAAVIEATARVIARERVDVVHVHGIDFDRYLPAPGPPVVATLHLPPRWYSREALRPARPDTHLCCVSEAQRAAVPSWAAPAHVIPNGVTIDALRFRRRKTSFCLVLARICPEKGIHEALDAADAARVPLVVAGDVGPWDAHRRYFEDVLARRLRPPHRWIGVAGLPRKRRLLAAARALLVPSRAPETSSLVAMEALASGTPVIAFTSGALPTIVDHGETGFIVENAASMARAIREVDRISPDACRRTAEQRFSAKVMTERYLALYEHLATRAPSTTSRGGPPHQSVATEPLAMAHVRGAEALGAIRAEWSDLWRRSPTATPFQTPEWLLAYVRAFCGPGAGAEPWAIVVRSRGSLVGIAPLCTRGSGPETKTTLLGDGVSDYLDVIVDPEHASSAISAILDELQHTAESSGSVVLDELRPCSPLVTSPPSDRIRRTIRGPCPVVRLSDGVDPIPADLRKKVNFYRRRAERSGGLVIEEASTPQAAAEWLETLFALHAARWTSRGQEGVLARPDVQQLQREAVTALAASGIARIYGLRVGVSRAAAMLVFRDAWAAYYYIGGFDPELASLSPGTILVAHAIDRAHADGLSELDFLRGREDYKYRFGACDRYNACLHLDPPRVPSAPAASPRSPRALVTSAHQRFHVHPNGRSS